MSVSRPSRRPLVFALALALAAFAAGAAPAEAQVTWPTDRLYDCNFVRADGSSGTSQIQFIDLAGNNYLRRGFLSTWIPTQAYPDWSNTVKVVVTKPVIIGPRTTHFEFTVAPNGPQCKSFRVHNGIYFNTLAFDECSNGVYQSCSQPADY